MTLDGIPLIDVGATALVGIVVLLILTGRLVPRSQLTDAHRRAEHWRRAAEEWATTANESARQLMHLQEGVGMAVEFIRAVRDRAEREREREREDL